LKKRLLAGLGALVVIVAACGGAASPSPSTAPGSTEPSAAPSATESNLAADQVLRIDLGNEPPTLDPNLAQDSTSIAVLKGLNRGLVYFDKDLNVVPSLASSWEFSPDGLTITFHLIDAKYSNGDPIKAGDFVYGWRRLMDPRIAAPYNYVMGPLAGSDALFAMAGQDPLPSDADIDAALANLGVAAPDDKTFVVTLASPATYFLSIAALWICVPVEESWITSTGATEAGNYVSSGPFVLDQWDHNNSIVLKPNPNWYGTAPTLTEIDMSMTAEPAQAEAAYESGALDMVLVPSADLRRVKDDPKLGPQVLDVPQFSVAYYGFGSCSADSVAAGVKCDPTVPTSNKELRIALTQAIDKQALIDTTYGGTGAVANSFIMPGIPGADVNLNVYPFDVASAKTHLATALTQLGLTDASQLPVLKLGYNTGSDHETRVAFMAEAWRTNLGINTEQVGEEWATFLTDRHKGAFALSRNGWGADYPHASNQLDGLFTCGGGNNDEQYCNPAFDALVKQAAGESDQTKQVALYKQAQEMLMADAPFVPLRFTTARFLVAPYLGGIHATGSDAQLPGDNFYEDIQILKH
jgi:oligopeptide transport system substrate-binding protein